MLDAKGEWTCQIKDVTKVFGPAQTKQFNTLGETLP